MAGGGTVLGYQAFYDRMTSNTNECVKQELGELKEKSDLILSTLNKTNIEQEKANNIVDLAKKLSNLDKDYKIRHEMVKNENESRMLYESYKSEQSEMLTKITKLGENANDNVSKNSILPVDDVINSYKNYLSNLSLTEICLVINICSSMLILSCMVTILLSVYGNKLIDKYDIKSKYPKLGKIIQARNKLQETYI